MVDIEYRELDVSVVDTALQNVSFDHEIRLARLKLVAFLL